MPISHMCDDSFKLSFQNNKKRKDTRQLLIHTVHHNYDKFVNIAVGKVMFGLVLPLIYCIDMLDFFSFENVSVKQEICHVNGKGMNKMKYGYGYDQTKAFSK